MSNCTNVCTGLSPCRNTPIGWQDAAREKLDPCYDPGCHWWENGETIRFQAMACKVGPDLLKGNALAPISSGTITSVVAFEVNDAAGTMSADGAAVDMKVKDTTNDELGTINSVISDIRIAFTEVAPTTMFVNIGDAYEIIAVEGSFGWAYNHTDDQIELAPDTNDALVIFPGILPANDVRYAVEIDVEDFVSGEGKVIFGDSGDTESLGSITGEGTWTFYGYSAGVSALDVRIEDTTNESDYKITGFRLYQTAEVKWKLLDEQGNTEDSGSLDVTLLDFVHDKGFVEITPNVTDGCYNVCLYDDTNLIPLNGDFDTDSDAGWTFDNATANGWSIDTVGHNLKHVGGSVGTNTATVDLNTTTLEDCEYTVAWTNGSVDPDDGPTDVLIILEDGTEESQGGFAGSGAKSFTFSGKKVVSIRWEADDSDNFDMDDISVTPDADCCNHLSKCIDIRATLPDEVQKFEHTIYACTDERYTLGKWAKASLDYVERMYLHSNVRYAGYVDEEFENFRDYSGCVQIIFSDRVKQYEMQIAAVPECTHDWLSLALKSNEFTINDLEYYAVDGDYSPNWDKRTRIAPVVVQIAEMNQNVKATLCECT